ncbi:DUF2334 domain-containing protein [Thermodesulforhabdus norvegica]|uniref:Polysaccharide deacetylase n=1 Tax=Thermodesulforhabdus norvegica TaxID=39841 RepID=A0A1I4UWH6_9BACT|nr:DUF2334 domain-containing protein [Thermodesulforhabdus norvegica]SFM93377.1 Polysaccharide deacetylase [Thermodesulforhabdus norvegica]
MVTLANLKELADPDMSGFPRPRKVSAVWKSLPANWQARLEEVLRRCAEREPVVFFRADDVGAYSHAFKMLLNLFRFYEIPLALAVVPAWMSAKRTEMFRSFIDLENPLWNWHQHGWRHVNWSRDGKKAEFGNWRTKDQQWNDILKGKRKLEGLFRNSLVPVFTPPWNRLDLNTLGALQQLGFAAVSIDGPIPRGAKQSVRLKNFRIYIDLHTRKSENPGYAYDELMKNLENALTRKGNIGIMIHHKMMNHAAFEFLNYFLYLIRSIPGIGITSFREMIENDRE